MAERGWVNRNLDWLVALAPCAAALLIGVLSAVLTLLSGEWALAGGAYGLLACVAAGVVAPFVVLGLRRPDALMWFIVSPCASALGIFFGVMLWLVGFGHICRGTCLS
jgi:hypothetical protein